MGKWWNKQLRSMSFMFANPLNIVTFVVILWFSIAFLIIPSINLLYTTFFPDGELSLRVIQRLMSSERAMKSIRNSFILAVILSVTVNITGIFIVLVTRYFDIKGAKVLWAGYATSLIYGGITLVSGYKFIYGDKGFFTKVLANIFPGFNQYWFTGIVAVVFVMTFATTGNHMLFLSTSIAKLDYQTVEASKLMGASTWKTLWKVVIPTLKPMIFAITALTFLGGINALMAPLILGGENFQTIAPMILTFSNNPTSRDLAAGLAIFLGLFTIVLIAVLNHLEKQGQYFSVSKVPTALAKQKIENPIANAVVHFFAYLLFIIYMIPPVMIVLFSFTNADTIQSGRFTASSFTLKNYILVFTDSSGYGPLLVSIIYGFLAATIVVSMILLAARMISKHRNLLSTMMEYFMYIPWVLPSILVALALILTYSRPQPILGGLILTGTTLLLLIGYIIEKIPFTFRLLKASYAGISDSLEEAAFMLGASAFYAYRKILLPLVLPAALSIAALNFNGILSDYTITAFLAHPTVKPLGIVIKNATSQETIQDSTTLIFVYTVFLMIIASIVIFMVYGDHKMAKRWIKNLKRRMLKKDDDSVVKQHEYVPSARLVKDNTV